MKHTILILTLSASVAHANWLTQLFETDEQKLIREGLEIQAKLQADPYWYGGSWHPSTASPCLSDLQQQLDETNAKLDRAVELLDNPYGNMP